MSHWGVVIEQLTHEDEVARVRRLRRGTARRGRTSATLLWMRMAPVRRVGPVVLPGVRRGAG